MSVFAMSLLRGSRKCVWDAEMTRWTDDFGRESDLNKTFSNDSKSWSGKRKKNKKIKKLFEFRNSKDFWNSMDLQSSKELAEFKRICKIQKDLQNSKKFAKLKRICKEFSVYKLILLLTKKKRKPQIVLHCRRGCSLPRAWLPVWLSWMAISCFRLNCLLKRFSRFDCQPRGFDFLLIISVMVGCLKTLWLSVNNLWLRF